MKTLTQQIRKKQSSLTTPKDIFRDENGAIDLASIMVGIIVIGLIGGVIAATVFAVIPWTQDNAAKQQLDSVVSAENAYMGLSSASPLPAGYIANSYTDSAGLASAGLLTTNPKYCVVPTNSGKGFQGFAASSSGSIWDVSNTNTKPAKFAGTLPTACAGITSAGASATPPVAALPAVNTTKRLRFGVAVPNGPLSNEVKTAAIDANEYPSIVSTYKDWTSPFSSAEVKAVYDAGSQPMVTWEPFNASTGGVTQPGYTLASIYNGQHDAYIDTWIASIKAQDTPKPILLRFGHEMNGNWYPWGSGVNGNVAGTYDSTKQYATGDYAKAWRYIHNKFTVSGVDKTKVQWVFAPNNTASNGEELWNFWPGAEYVDYNGLSGFNWGTKGGPKVWQQPWEVFGGGLWHLNNDANIKGKPIIITETASVPTEGTRSQAQWISDLVNWLGTNPDNTNVVAFVYFDSAKVEEGAVMIDWRYNATPEGSNAMKTALATRPN